MALAIVRAIVAAAAVLSAQSSCASATESPEVSCIIGEETVVRKITTPGTSFKVLCKDDAERVSESPPEVCADLKCEAQGDKLLKVACPGGGAAKARENSLTVDCPQLPNAQATVFLLCGGIPAERKDDVCAVELQVFPPPPQGPQICAAAGSTTTLAIHGETGRTQFACAPKGLTELHPRETGKVFKEDCTSEEDLGDLKLTTDKSYKVLEATKKPRTRKLCYVCRESTGSSRTNKECKIIIDVSAGSELFKRTALGLACSIVVTFLQLR